MAHTSLIAVALCPVLVGRAGELSALTDALAEAAAGRGSLVLLSGEAGVGKTRLAREALALARARGMAIMAGRAVAGATPTAFRPWSEALLSGRRTSPSSVPIPAEPLSDALALLVPGDPERARPPPGELVLAVGDAVLRALVYAGRSRGCLLVLEDLHWSDPETLEVLEFIADNVADQRVACVCTVRSEAPSDALGVAGRLVSRRVARRVELGRLADADVGHVARGCLGLFELPPGIEAFLTARADGLPLLVEDLIASLIDAGVLARDEGGWTVVSSLPAQVPRAFADSVHQRLFGADANTHLVLQAASVLGRRFDWSLLGDITGLEEPVVARSLRQAVELQLLAVEGGEVGGFVFRHALGRDALLAGILPPDRAALSAAAVVALERAHPGLPGPLCELAAELAELAGNRTKAATLLLEAGRRALSHGALVTAEGSLERARRMVDSDDAELWLDVADALTETFALAGKVERVFEIGGAVLGRLTMLDGHRSRLAEVHLRLAGAALAGGRWDIASDHLARARTCSAPAPDVSSCRFDALGAHIALEKGLFDEAVSRARCALETAERCGHPAVACEALEVLGREARSRGRMAEAEAAFARAHAVAEEHGLIVWRLRALHEVGTMELMYTTGVERLESARSLAGDAGALALAAVLDLQIAAGLGLQFRGEEALVVAQRSVDASRRFRLRTLPKGIVLVALAHAVRGERAAMEEAAAEAMALAPEDTDIAASVWGHCRATVSLLEEERERARRELETGWEILSVDASGSLPFPALWALMQAVDDSDSEMVCAQVRAAGHGGSGIADGLLSYADAVVLGRAGGHEAATAAFTAGDLSLGPALHWYRHYGRRLVATTALVDGWGAPVRWLREASSYFDARGDARIARACRSMLRDAGAPVSRRGRGDTAVPPALRALEVTSREMDVLALVAQSLSNREIGTRLYLSPRTVENHISHLLTKTGAKNREGLAALLAQ